MMVTRVFALVGGALALGVAASAVAAPAPTVNDDYQWNIRINDEERTQSAILAYEMPDSDDQPLNFTCELGGNRIFAGISGASPELTAIQLTSGDQLLRLKGATEVDEIPYFTSEEITGGSPFIKAFAVNGWLRLTAKGGTLDMAASASGKQAIKRFVAFCTG